MPPVRRASTARMFVVFAVLSAVPVCALGVVLDATYRDGVEAQGLAQGRAQAAMIEEMAVSPALSGADLGEGLTDEERMRLSAATDLAVFKGSVSRLRLRDFDGRVVFSDDGRLDVPRSQEPAFRAAAAGRTTAELVETPAGLTVRVARPVIASASGRATGVLEVWLPYADIVEAVDALARQAWMRLLVGLLLLYAVLAALAWSTSRSLRRHAAQREHEALHDALTGLPNRTLFSERAVWACAAATDAEPVALVLVDLDRFKVVNDTLGHHAGDRLLQTVARRLAAAARGGDTVARLGGDEFALVLPGVGDEVRALGIVEELRARLCEELTLDGVVLSVEASMGVALVPAHGRDVETLLQRADAAMYRGKRGIASVVMADAADRGATGEALRLHTDIRHALEEGQFLLHYQPKVDLADGRVVGVEALARWHHPRRGVVGPAEFLPVIESTDLVHPFTDWVLHRAVSDLRSWTRSGLDWTVAVNVSARNLEAPDFAVRLTQLLVREQVPAHRLVVEITETALAADVAALSTSTHALTAAGVAVSIDDFGTGWGSLTQLRDLPVSEVKIDRSFVTHLDIDPQDQALVQSVITLAHGLGCTVTAEGVESEATAAFLRAAGCDHAQGYLWSPAVPVSRLLASHDPAPDPAPVPTQRTPARSLAEELP